MTPPMKTKPKKKDSPPLAAVTCSPAMAGLAQRLEEKAAASRKRAVGERDECLAAYDTGCCAAFHQAASMARQCQESSVNSSPGNDEVNA